MTSTNQNPSLPGIEDSALSQGKMALEWVLIFLFTWNWMIRKNILVPTCLQSFPCALSFNCTPNMRALKLIWSSSSTTSWGWPSFISLDTLDNSDRRFSVKDSCITEAVVTIRGTATAL
ncbi:hypothetical protein ACFX2J_011996 [Malus domestica]